MVTADMIKERFGRNGKKDILQLFQIPYAGYLDSRFGITEHKVTKTEIIGNNPAKIDIHLRESLRVLSDAIALWPQPQLWAQNHQPIAANQPNRFAPLHRPVAVPAPGGGPGGGSPGGISAARSPAGWR